MNEYINTYINKPLSYIQSFFDYILSTLSENTKVLNSDNNQLIILKNVKIHPKKLLRF